MLPFTPTPLSTASTTTDSMLRPYPFYPHANRLYNEAPEEVRDANMRAAVGVPPLTLRVGNPIATYKLNKLESPHPNLDHVFLHMEKHCALDALLYPQWKKLSLYCEMFREIMYGVIKASLEMPKCANLMLTMTKILALPDEAPRVEGNPMSTRFHWRAPLHQYRWRDLQQGEIPGTFRFQLYPQPPQRQGLNIARFQKAMESHIQPSLSNSASIFTGRTTSNRADDVSFTTASHTTEAVAGSSVQEQNITLDSDAESVQTTTADVFAPASKMKKAFEKRTAMAMASGLSNSTSWTWNKKITMQ